MICDNCGDRMSFDDFVDTDAGPNSAKLYECDNCGACAYGDTPAAQPAPEQAGDRDTMLRNDLFGRVQDVLDGCNPAVANEFRNYRALAEKQIQERDERIATLQRELAEARRTVAALEGAAKAFLDEFTPLEYDDYWGNYQCPHCSGQAQKKRHNFKHKDDCVFAVFETLVTQAAATGEPRGEG